MMDEVQAREDLASSVIRERLAAARYLARTATADDSEFLRERLRDERVQWVRDALRAALSRTELAADASAVVVESDEIAEQRSRALVEVTGQLLHELEPLVGLVRAHLLDEWTGFEGTRSEASLGRLDEFLDVMADLHAAAQVPVLREVELQDLMNDIAGEVVDQVGVPVQTAGPTLRVISDPRLIRLIVRNGLRNAAEAVEDSNGDVVLSWGRAREGFFVSVLDQGVGVPEDFSMSSVLTGTSTKQGHLGMGLTLMRYAADSLGADVSLTARADRGARLELRCPDGA